MVYNHIKHYECKGDSLVALVRQLLLTDEESTKIIPAVADTPCERYLYPIYELAAVINLAPGEYLERSDDSERI